MTAAASRAEARVRGGARTSAVARHARVSAGGSAEQRGATSDRERLARRLAASVPWRDGACCLECWAYTCCLGRLARCPKCRA